MVCVSVTKSLQVTILPQELEAPNAGAKGQKQANSKSDSKKRKEKP